MHTIGKENKTFKQLKEVLYKDLPPLFLVHEIKKRVAELQKEYLFDPTMAYRLTKSALKLDISWNEAPVFNLYYIKSKETDFPPLDILAALTKENSSYVSHYSGLYYNGLIEQTPSDFFVTSEIPGKSGEHSSDLNELRIRQAFLKPARTTSKYFTYEKCRYFMLEKTTLDKAGVEEKGINIQGKPTILHLTSVERTLLDSIISPHYAGGLTTVVKAFSKAQIDVYELISIYDELKLFYPYWQSIGFLLDNLGKLKEEQIWSERFEGQKKIHFYLDRNVRLSWDFSEKWKISFPKGLFKNVNN